ncbi:MAG: tyrosine--tRNA ligase [Myxococcaceae bacterium]
MGDFLEELRWRRLLHEAMPETDALLKAGPVKGYIGFDPTADSLGVGNLVQVMTLLHFQRAGHIPFALMGGATGMVGDPSGKSEERNLLTSDTLAQNLAGQKKQLERFLDFSPSGGAQLVNNYDWFSQVRFLDFIRDAGKHISVNYMLRKDSVRNRIEKSDEGMSFTEFTYQLIQGWDFYWLYKHHGVKLQMGGSDQWGNITTGTELIRRKEGSEAKAYAITTPLITKGDGTKFGKTEKGNVWLDAKRTSPYEFFQFWLNASDDDVKNYIRIFTLLDRATVEGLEAEHAAAPHERKLQKTLARDITVRVHGQEQLDVALAATEVLFGKGTIDQLKALSEEQFVQVFVGAGVRVAEVPRDAFGGGVPVIELFSEKSQLAASKGEARKLLESNALSINKAKVADTKATVGADQLINGRYLLLQKGKKDYCLVKAV